MTARILEKEGAIKASKELVFENIAVEGYEQVIKISNKKTKLNAIIAIHNTKLGMALGGIRIQPYKTFNDALMDVLRLSKGMTYKSAIAGVGFGGGKSVIIADPKTAKTEELLLSFGEAVEALNGRYICAEDMGCTVDDVMTIRRVTKYVTGLPSDKSSGDPGRFTAWGIYRGMQSALKKIYGQESVKGRKVAIQGLGNVGLHMLEYLFWQGADLILSDIDEEKAKKMALKYGAKCVTPSEIYKVECDIFSPCAIGGILNDETIPQLRCKAVVGCANNQLLKEDHGKMLKNKKILYAPDFVVNAGGLFNVSAEVLKDGYNPIAPRDQTDRVFDGLIAIYEIADKNNISTNEAAIQLADYRIQYGIGKRQETPYFPNI
ncbi:MAG: Glu/Leu/Phe/Val dehydrogenase [Chlamydiae bacterium]|nr:Glu/Leu/Phe/Val dehydrogenase [Chlamydiota bacterium]